MKLKTLLTSIGLGAGLMYFYDPQHGERRREMVRDRANRFVSDIDNTIDVAMQDARNRTRGMLSEMTARLSEEGTPDWILEERVRSSLGRIPSYTRGVNVRAEGGRIYLTGPAMMQDTEAIVKAAMRTRGVRGVENKLQTVNSQQEISGFPSEPTIQRQTRTDAARHNWSPATRLLSSVGGSLLTLYGLTRKGVAKPVLSTAGLVLTARGMTNLDTRSLLGLGLGENAIRVNKSINIFAPIDEVYQFWRNFENFPLFMNHVKAINVQGDTSTWTVVGPGDSSYQFQSEITQDIPNELIAWETRPESDIHSSGFVRFDGNRDGSTRVTVQMSYVPPVGALGHAVAQLFGVDPRQSMHEDLMRLKTLLEEGKTSTEETKVEYTRTNQGPTNSY
jgi:uncharacterized membrane protein